MDYYKIIGKNFGHFPYHLGINSLAETSETFDPNPECGPGGLYFTTLKHILEYLAYGDRLCRVRIPNDAQVVQVGDKWKADQIEIVDIQPLDFDWLVAQGVDVHAHEEAAFRWGASSGHLAAVECLLKQGVDVHVGNDAALRGSAYYGHTEVVKCLLAHDADIHAENDAALKWATDHGHTGMVECLQAHLKMI